MKPAKLFVNGQELHIDKSIGKGGEGEVFAIANMPGFAVKAYLPSLVSEREKKIRAMVSIDLASNAPMVAFPTQVVADGNGNFAGFIMRLVEKHKEIHELQTPSSRQKHFPKADYRFIVRVALNIAKVFAQVHTTGCVIGDINQRGILVSPNATVVLIDADSFQVVNGDERYLCVVGVPEYTPPELQGKSLKSVVRTTDHDAFGLAVCLFQLLCMDRHPFSGRYVGSEDMPLEKAIAEYRFAYSTRDTGMSPPPSTVALNDFTPRVMQYFEQAFSIAHLGRRPSAAAWVAALTELENSLRVCSRSKLHLYARNSKECPWCRMETGYGRLLFIDTNLDTISALRGRLDPVQGFLLDISSLIAAINRVAVPASISVPLPKLAGLPPPSQKAKDALSEKLAVNLWRLGGLGALVCAWYSLVSGVEGFVALAMAALGFWLLFRSPPSTDVVQNSYSQALADVEARIRLLQSSSPIEGVIRKKIEALDLIDEFKLLATAFENVRNGYDKRRRTLQEEGHLLQHAIRNARIAKVSSGDIASLASYGFTTALDAHQKNVQQVSGIGPVKGGNIMAWVKQVRAKFQFQVTYTQEDQQNILQAQSTIITQQQGVGERIKRAIDELQQAANAFEHWKLAGDAELLRLTRRLAQTEVDSLHLGLTVHKLNVPPIEVPDIATFKRSLQMRSLGTAAVTGSSVRNPFIRHTSVTRSQATTCPKCRGAMVRRKARKGSNAGKDFWGCHKYPRCNGVRPI